MSFSKATGMLARRFRIHGRIDYSERLPRRLLAPPLRPASAAFFGSFLKFPPLICPPLRPASAARCGSSAKLPLPPRRVVISVLLQTMKGVACVQDTFDRGRVYGPSSGSGMTFHRLAFLGIFCRKWLKGYRVTGLAWLGEKVGCFQTRNDACPARLFFKRVTAFILSPARMMALLSISDHESCIALFGNPPAVSAS